MTRTIIAYEGNRPIYASKKLLAWRKKAEELRLQVERLPAGPERDLANSEYLAHLCS